MRAVLDGCACPAPAKPAPPAESRVSSLDVPHHRMIAAENRNDMWYVAQVQAGSETATRDKCLQTVPHEVMRSCFVPEYETMRKVDGDWHKVKRLLFSGYLFLVARDAGELGGWLKRVPARMRLLGAGDGAVSPLSPGERDWFLSFMDDSHCVRMSEGVIEGDQVRVTKGPLMGSEGCIRKIDRHKRRASIEMTMFGRTVTASVGLEVFRKTA